MCRFVNIVEIFGMKTNLIVKMFVSNCFDDKGL